MTKSLQFRFFNQTYHFRFKVGFFLLCLFFFCLCLMAGKWQLHRYQYKKNLLATYQLRLASLPQSFAEIRRAPDEMEFQPVRVRGHYINGLTVLIQNRIYRGKVGFEIVTPLKIKGEKKLLLIDRGWTDKPDHIDIIAKEQSVLGRVKLLNERQFILGKNILNPTITPLIIQKIDIAEISKVTQQSYYPYILRLDSSQPYGFVRDWVITTILPQRHLAYAIQWFLLAMVLCIAYFCFCCERLNKQT